jgi:hypothetical protein
VSGVVYCFDTSGLIDGLERYYFPDRFPALWERVGELVAVGRLLISEEVFIESQRMDAVLKDWRGNLPPEAIVQTHQSIATVVGQIGRDFSQWTGLGTKNQADPFVIAVAEVRGAVVVTGEKPGGPGKPKIPYVCGQRGIEVIKFPAMIRREGWTFAG